MPIPPTTAAADCVPAVRLKQHQESSIHIARWLSARPEVARVNHPALPECPGHEYFQRDFTGSSGLFSFVLKKRLTDEQMANFLDNFSLFHMAYSWVDLSRSFWRTSRKS